MNKARLDKIDELLQKGWQSYYDLAKAVYGKPGEVYSYKDFTARNRGSIAQDFRLIQDIWYASKSRKLIPSGSSKSDKSPLRNEIFSSLFEVTKKKQFPNGRVQELLIQKGEYGKNPNVKYYRYKDSHYSIISSGDYERYIDLKEKSKVDGHITDEELHDSLFDSDLVLENEVSYQIKRSIQLRDELKVFEKQSREIVDSLLQKIAAESDDKKANWVHRAIGKYKNILELVKNPLSNYDPRDVASRIHEFAFFLASENQYHLLGKRFEEALVIYNKLQREQRHLVEDIEQGLVLGDEADVDIGQMKEQMQRDDDSVAAILLSLARVSLDSGDEKKAKELIKKAKGLSYGESLTYAQICHLESVIAGMDGNVNHALTFVDEASTVIHTLDLENSADGMAILASKAELMLRMGKTEEAKELYGSLLAKDCADDAARETRTSAYLNFAVINLSEGQIEEADRNVSVALSEFQALYEKEPDKHLPNVLTAKYIKGLALMHLGDMESAISILEEACSMVPDNRPDLYALCGAELLEIYVTLHDLFASTGCFDRANDMSIKAKELLTMPAISLSDEQKETIIQRF